MGARLRKFQQAAIRRVVAKCELGFLDLLVVLMAQYDTELPRDFLFGMIETIPLSVLFQDTENHNQQIRSQLRPGKDDFFIFQQSTKDAEADFYIHPLNHAQLLRLFKGQPFRLISRCVVTQTSGKQWIIINANAAGQSDLNSDPNKVVPCSPLQPVQHIVLAMNLSSDGQRASSMGSCLLARRLGRASVSIIYWSPI